MDKEFDCDFYYFKPSGKWKYEGVGFFPDSDDVNHQTIKHANGDKMPGIMGDGTDYTIVVIPKPNCSARFAYPRLINAPYGGPDY